MSQSLIYKKLSVQDFMLMLAAGYCCDCRALHAVEVVQEVDEVEPVDQEEEMTDRTSVEKLSWTCQSESEPYSLLLTIDVAAIEYHDHSLSSRYADKRVRVKFSGGRESE